jgi:hypothetical protein
MFGGQVSEAKSSKARQSGIVRWRRAGVWDQIMWMRFAAFNARYFDRLSSYSGRGTGLELAVLLQFFMERSL